MVNQKKPTKKLLAVVLAVFMVLSTIPAGLFTTVFAATPECMAVEVDGVKVYFYGAETLEVDGNTVKFTGGNGNLPSLYIDGNSENPLDPDDVVADEKSVTFKPEWLANQSEWIAVQCDNTVDVPSSEPNVDVDKTAPEIADDGITGNPTSWTKNNVTLTINATDVGTGVVSYSKDKINWTTENVFVFNENGTYTFYAKDAVGNVSEGKEIEVSFIDKIPPTISSVFIDPNTWTNEAVTLIVAANDDRSGLAAEAYKMDDGEWQTSNEFVVSDSETHIFYVRDAVGNEQTTTQKADKHDVVKPKITKIEVKWGTITIDSDTFTSPYVNYDFYITATDDKSGVAQYSCDKENWQTENKFSLKGAGIYTFYVKDNAGNISEVKELSLSGDSTAPQISGITKSTTEPTNQPVTITITATDNIDGSGLHNKAYAIDSKNNWQKENTFVISDSNKHIIYVRDAAKPENIAEQEITIDNFCDITPTIESVDLSTTEWTNKTIVATVNGTGTTNDANRTFEIVAYKMDDGEWKPANTFEINDCNTHKFYVKDSAGNISEAIEKAAINYDINMPTLSDGIAVKFTQDNTSLFANIINKLSFGRFFNERLVIAVDAKDVSTYVSNVSGIVSATFKFTDIKNNTYEFEAKKIGNSEDATIQFVVEKGDLPKDFKGAAEIVLIDKAGNENTISVTTGNSDMGEISGDSAFNFMIENTPPTIDDIKSTASSVNAVYKADYTVDFTVSDKSGTNNSGIARAKVEVNGTLVKEVDFQNGYTDSEIISVSTNAVNKEVNDVSISNWSKGELKYVITVIDNAGNEVQDSRIYKFDQTAPQITGFGFDKADDKYYKDENKFSDIYEAVSIEDYGFYFKNTVEVTVTAEDIQNENEAVATGVKSISVYLENIDGTIYVVPENNAVIQKSDNNTADIVAVPTKDKLVFTIPQDFKGQIYAYATDNVDNSPVSCRFITDNDVNADGFVHPDGSIVETTAKHTDTSSIEFTSVPMAQGSQNTSSTYKYNVTGVQKDKSMDYLDRIGTNNVPLYNKDISFGVKVTDTYSGIKEVSYTIIEGKETIKKTVSIKNDGTFKDDVNEGWEIANSDKKDKDFNLVTEMTNTIAVSGNYNDMVLLIELTDRAGNKSYDYYMFGIDKTAPTITVTYDNNDADTQSGTGSYFKADRTATVLVQERNFNTENVKFTIKNAEGEAPKVVDKGIVTKDTDGNGDGNVYKYVIAYSNEGVYSFDVEYTDRATNKASVDYKNSVAPKAFILDKTFPTITVSYDNNEAQNEKFFKAHRTATITIVEHNFDVNRVVITQTSALSGNAITNPSVSWINSGNTHTATINYNNDGDYTFDITMTDKAGNKEANVNYGSSVAAKDFTIDTTYSDIVKVDGIADKGVLGLVNGEIDADANINITINDVNLDNYNIKLTRSRVLVTGESDETEDASQENIIDNPETQAENGIDVTSKYVSNASGSANATAVISIPKRDDGVKNDGLYTLTIEAKDKAGNAYDTNANIITFSVNRFGSVFTFSNDLYKLINDNDGYTQSVASNDLTVYEYNATAISDETVEVIANNESKTLNENADYTVNTENQQDAGSWSKNTYKIKPENFKNDGVYTLRLSSQDAASITSQTVDYDVCSATFRVDSTPADIISVNYSTEVEKMLIGDTASAKTDKLTINFTVEDLIRLEKIEVFVNDMENPLDTYTYGKDFDDANTFDGGQFVIDDGGAKTQNFKIVVTDKAGNVIDTSNKEQYKPGYVFFDQLVVSQNAFVQFYANKVWFFGSIAGVALLTGFIIFIVVKKRKKDDEEQSK